MTLDEYAQSLNDVDLIAELRELDNSILTEMFTSDDVSLHQALSGELQKRGYSIKRRTVLDIEKSDNPTFL